MNVKISFIGVGRVGSTTAFSVLQHELADEIVLIDANTDLANGESLDLLHSTPFSKRTNIYSSDYKSLDGSSIVVVSAGVSQKPGETRLDLLNRNSIIMNEIANKISSYAPNSIVLMLTNPVDILSYVVWEKSGFPSERIIGSGTVLDTARLRSLISQHCGISPSSIHVYVIGEHGDSELAIWSSAMIGGVPLNDFCQSCPMFSKNCSLSLKELFEETRNSAYEIISKKGYTNYAIAASATAIIESIIRDEKRVLTVSILHNDIYISYPCVVGEKGVERIVDIKINEEEYEQFKKSVSILKDWIEKLHL